MVSNLMLTSLNDVKGDVNKLVSECCFDVFVGCPAHMALLLDPKIKTVSFGITVTDAGVWIVVRGNY